MGYSPWVTESDMLAHTRQASPSHGKGPDGPSACVAGLPQRRLQQEEACVLQTVSTRCAARPHGSMRRGPIPPATCNKRVGLTSRRLSSLSRFLRSCLNWCFSKGGLNKRPPEALGRPEGPGCGRHVVCPHREGRGGLEGALLMLTHPRHPPSSSGCGWVGVSVG